ncbi:hypothetical protein BN940_09456 [Castellaniella defragrans 65Phen]|uniref:Uncharacterized protein n=1 Tax=Castellaniella defragrans (strain DSM 12143 / CCUG 39792 / 65Phen) TaxID=1437824 RepID=W8X4E9_CASD6|nr:hypothetical protein BN940_09456 [Castellaniella defragrans 65Phen]
MRVTPAAAVQKTRQTAHCAFLSIVVRPPVRRRARAFQDCRPAMPDSMEA